jgi:dihydroorotase
MITSHHLPQDWDAKVCEFEYAKAGAIGLESAFGAVWSLLEGRISLDRWVEMVSIKPRDVFHLDKAEIKAQHTANLTLFIPGQTYEFNHVHSASKNSPFLGKTLKGKVIGTVLNDKVNVSQ